MPMSPEQLRIIIARFTTAMTVSSVLTNEQVKQYIEQAYQDALDLGAENLDLLKLHKQLALIVHPDKHPGKKLQYTEYMQQLEAVHAKNLKPEMPDISDSFGQKMTSMVTRYSTKQDLALRRYPGFIYAFLQFILLLPALVSMFIAIVIPWLLALPERFFSAIVEAITGGGVTRAMQAFMQSGEGLKLHTDAINQMRVRTYNLAMQGDPSRQDELYETLITSSEDEFLLTMRNILRAMGTPESGVSELSAEAIDKRLALNNYYGFGYLVYVSQALWSTISDSSKNTTQRIASSFGMLLILPVLAIYSVASTMVAAISYAASMICSAAIVAVKEFCLLPITLMDAVKRFRATTTPASNHDDFEMGAPGRNSPLAGLGEEREPTATAAPSHQHETHHGTGFGRSAAATTPIHQPATNSVFAPD